MGSVGGNSSTQSMTINILQGELKASNKLPKAQSYAENQETVDLRTGLSCATAKLRKYISIPMALYLGTSKEPILIKGLQCRL